MGTLVDVVVHAFYVATIAALIFFVHKVLWLVRYKALQGELVAGAVKKLRDDNLAVLEGWEAFATKRWSEALAQPDVKSPSNFVRRVEEWLGKLREDMQATRRSIEATLGNALADGKPVDEVVLSLRRLGGGGTRGPERHDVRLVVGAAEVATPKAPDSKLFELNVRSRYGIVRRALVFFSGAADVVYSSQHVALMSQNAHVPTGVLVRRLSLVFLVIACVLVDWAFGLRAALSSAMNDWLFPASHGGYLAVKTAAEKSFFEENGGSILAFVLWMAGYGAIYLALFFSVRRNYQVSVRRLRRMMASEPVILRAMRDRRVKELVGWGKEYGRSLDGAVGITLRHAETLLDHCEVRLRRRVASAALLEGARTIGDALFSRLPESTGALADAATSHAHSLSHYVWPRVDEMTYQVQLAQYRAAWQHIEVAEGELRKESPDPHKAHTLWRAVVTYATIFAAILPEGLAGELRDQYAHMVDATIEATDRDLEELDRRLGELAQRLNEQLDSAKSLVDSKVELANHSVTAASLAFAAEIVHVREQARLEAMAFEI